MQRLDDTTGRRVDINPPLSLGKRTPNGDLHNYYCDDKAEENSSTTDSMKFAEGTKVAEIIEVTRGNDAFQFVRKAGQETISRKTKLGNQSTNLERTVRTADCLE